MARDIVIMSVDRSDPQVVRVNTAVDLLHCPLTLPKSALKQLGYYVFRPAPLKPLIYALIERHIARNGGKLLLGGITLSEDDLADLPVSPD
ncbi:MAG: hypothetical protein M0Z53_10200 [Thermaerobacter sp.]|nr:hypothetical protein [Thermaerobacter sp.]